jgi:hypothetical protein
MRDFLRMRGFFVGVFACMPAVSAPDPACEAGASIPASRAAA